MQLRNMYNMDGRALRTQMVLNKSIIPKQNDIPAKKKTKKKRNLSSRFSFSFSVKFHADVIPPFSQKPKTSDFVPPCSANSPSLSSVSHTNFLALFSEDLLACAVRC